MKEEIRRYSFRVFEGRQGFEESRSIWLSLESEVRNTAFYQTYRWFKIATDCNLEDIEKLAIVVGFESDTPILLMPLGKQSEQSASVRKLVVAGNDHLIPRDILCKNVAYPKELAEEFRNWFSRSELSGFDVIEAKNVPANAHFTKLNRSGASGVTEDREAGSAVISCVSNLESNLAHISGKFLRNMRRIEKRAGGIGIVSLEKYEGEECSGKAVREFIEIENKGWKSEDASSIMSDANLVSFYSNLVRLNEAAIEARIYLLRVGEKYLAGQLGMVSNRTYQILKIGFDEEFAFVSPGHLLMMQVIKDLSSDQCVDMIDLITNPVWAEKWRSGLQEQNTVRIFSRTFRGVRIYMLETVLKKLRIIKKTIYKMRFFKMMVGGRS